MDGRRLTPRHRHRHMWFPFEQLITKIVDKVKPDEQ